MKFILILLNFDKWVIASNIVFQSERIYINKKWTPFIKLAFAYKPWHFRVFNNIFNSSLVWSGVPETERCKRKKSTRRVSSMDQIIKRVNGFMLP